MIDTALKALYLPRAFRLLLWIVLLLLTSAILLFPVTLKFEYHAVESLYIFGDYLWLFSIIYIIWLVSLVLLLLSRCSKWQRLILISIFSLICLGFWVIITPNGMHVDGMTNMGLLKYILKTGSIPFDHPVLQYAQYPGFSLTALSITEVTGLDIFVVRMVFLLFCRVLFAILLYILFSKLLKNDILASIAVFLVIISSSLLPRIPFHPHELALIMFILLLIILTDYNEKRIKIPTILTFVILISVFTITYLPLPVFFMAVICGIIIIQIIVKKFLFNYALLILPIFIFCIWQVYFAQSFFVSTIGWAENFISNIFEPFEYLSSFFTIIETQYTETMPFWAFGTTMFWIWLLIGFSAILGIKNIFQLKRLKSAELLMTAGFWGILVISLVSIFAYPGGGQWYRVIIYTPIFSAPILVSFLSKNILPQMINSSLCKKILVYPPLYLRKYSLTILILIMIILAFPSFLIPQSNVNTQAIYEYEIKAGEFLENNIDADLLHLFSSGKMIYISTYFVPDSGLTRMHKFITYPTFDDVVVEMNNMYDIFNNSLGCAIFAYTERIADPYYATNLDEAAYNRLLEFNNRLSKNNKIYDNVHVQLYTNNK